MSSLTGVHRSRLGGPSDAACVFDSSDSVPHQFTLSLHCIPGLSQSAFVSGLTYGFGVGLSVWCILSTMTCPASDRNIALSFNAILLRAVRTFCISVAPDVSIAEGSPSDPDTAWDSAKWSAIARPSRYDFKASAHCLAPSARPRPCCKTARDRAASWHFRGRPWPSGRQPPWRPGTISAPR